MIEIRSFTDAVLFVSSCLTLKDAVIEAVSKRANLYGADLSGADLSRANLSGKKIHSLRAFSGLYCYQVWAVVFEDGSRWIRMGCLFYDLDKWEKIGIRNSNVSEYPNDGSELCEERVAAFEFAKAAALRMTAPPVAAEATHV